MPNGTPDDVVEKLQTAYGEAVKASDFVTLMKNRWYPIMGISGQEPTDFLTSWQQSTARLMQDAGFPKTRPKTSALRAVRVRPHTQKIRVAARAIAERATVGGLS